METTTHQTARSIDVTGLPEEAIRAMEVLVSQLRGQPHPPAERGGIGSFRSYEEWSKALREWAESHPRRDTLADDSRETIYADDRDE
jgi:hypothetical protein